MEVDLQRAALLSCPAGGTLPARPFPANPSREDAEGLVLTLSDLLLYPSILLQRKFSGKCKKRFSGLSYLRP